MWPAPSGRLHNSGGPPSGHCSARLVAAAKATQIEGGGAGYWKPSHAAHPVFWNVDEAADPKVDVTALFGFRPRNATQVGNACSNQPGCSASTGK